MIRVFRCEPPDELTPEKRAELVSRFKADKSQDVWNATFIRTRLLSMSHFKCCYCETDITEESKYMEVDHFRGKEDFPEEVATWGNLLASCKRCNVRKGKHNVDTQGMIIDPTSVDPQQHLHMRNYRLHGLTPLGEKTIEVVYLNQSDRVVKARFDVGERTQGALDKIRAIYGAYSASTTIDLERRILRGMEELLLEAQPHKEYSATTATVLIESPDFNYLLQELKARGLWGAGLDALYTDAARTSLSNNIAA